MDRWMKFSCAGVPYKVDSEYILANPLIGVVGGGKPTIENGEKPHEHREKL